MILPEVAADIARARAKERGWGLAEPVSVQARRSWFGSVTSYDVLSNPRLRGTRTKFIIDAKDGEIISEHYLPR